jgi:hypothetical protein
MIHSDSEAVTGDTGLCHLEDSTANSEPISNANLIIGEAIDGEIFPKLSVLEVSPAELALPVSIRLELIDHHGTLFATMALKIRLPIAIQIQAACKNAVGYGMLPDCCTYPSSLPFNFARKTDIDGHQFRHRILGPEIRGGAC